MGNIKNLNPLSEWLTFELDTDLLDPPVVKFRVRPTSGMSGLNVKANDRGLSSTFCEMVIDAIQDWDLADAGEPIPCDSAMKQKHAIYLRCLLGARLKDEGKLLGIELALFAGDTENFLKN